MHSITKFSPIYLFYNYNEEMNDDIKKNMIKSQEFRKKNQIQLTLIVSY